MTVAVSCNMHVRITKCMGNLITGGTRYKSVFLQNLFFIVEADSELLLTRKLLNQGFLVIKLKYWTGMSKSMKACSVEKLNTIGVSLPQPVYGYLQWYSAVLTR